MRWPFSKKVTSNKEEARRFYNAKDYEKAEPFLDAMLKENPNDAWAMDVLSRLYMNTGRHGAAVVLLSRALRQQSEPALMRRIVKAGCNSKQLDVVLEHAELLEWTVEDEDLLLKIYDSFWPNERCVLFFHLTEWDPSLQFTSYLRAAYLFENGEIESSHDLIKRMIVEPVKNDATLVVALKVCESLGLQERAETLFDEHFKTNLNASRKRSLAKKLRHAKRYEKSLRVAQFVLEDEPDDEQMLTLVTELATKVDSPSVGINAFHTLDSLGKAKTFHVRRYANAAIAQGSPDDIVKAVQRLSSIGADATATYRKSYTKLAELQADDEAKLVLELIKEEPLQVELKVTKAVEIGDYSTAINLLDVGLEHHPNHVPFIFKRGTVFNAMGRLEDALRQFDLVLEHNSEHSSATTHRLNCGIKVWSENQYFEEISGACMRYPSNLNFQFARLNYVLSVLNDYQLATEIIETCLSFDPENQRAQLYRALVLSWKGDHDEASSSIKKSLMRWPESNDVWITAAQIEKNAGNPRMQLKHINTMLKLNQLAPIASSSPTFEINPHHLSTMSKQDCHDDRLVSIIMTCYKRDPLLKNAIASILNQTYKNIELIIVDDCSPDDNYSYLKDLTKNDDRVQVYQMNKNGGTYVAKNFGMGLAKGEFIGFMDSDDYSHAERIERQVAYLDAHSDVMAVTNDYFRVDESSDIEFRGIGALRMACISLLLRSEVVDQIGYFDSLRVGADSEYIERIEAYFGPGSTQRERLPTMIVMLHRTSLSGGGPFHISWRSISGHRLQHHRSFRQWHKKIKSGISSPYVRKEMRWRPYKAPDSMKSHPLVWKRGDPLFSDMIHKRHKMWWREKLDVWQKHLSAKLNGRKHVEDLGLKVPDMIWTGESINQIPENLVTPSRYVIKPERGWSSNNVYCINNGIEILTHRRLSFSEIIRELEENDFIQKEDPSIIVEELLSPENKEDNEGLPRDYKFYTFGEKIAMVHVVFRVSEIDKTQNLHFYLDSDFRPFPEQIMTSRPLNPYDLEKPDCWEEMVEAVKKIGSSVHAFMRIDMYATNRGAVFGEFTPTPHGGNGYSEFADRYLGSFWKGEEGVE